MISRNTSKINGSEPGGSQIQGKSMVLTSERMKHGENKWFRSLNDPEGFCNVFSFERHAGIFVRTHDFQVAGVVADFLFSETLGGPMILRSDMCKHKENQ